jgi:septal ring-binding cell division protein DamX
MDEINIIVIVIVIIIIIIMYNQKSALQSAKDNADKSLKLARDKALDAAFAAETYNKSSNDRSNSMPILSEARKLLDSITHLDASKKLVENDGILHILLHDPSDALKQFSDPNALKQFSAPNDIRDKILVAFESIKLAAFDIATIHDEMQKLKK